MRVREMDTMGAWSEDGTVWLPRSAFPTRGKAREFFRSETGIPWIQIRVLARFARFAPDHPSAGYYDGEYWEECKSNAPGAFPVWRVE